MHIFVNKERFQNLRQTVSLFVSKILSVRNDLPHCANARRNRCQEHLKSFPFGELEETTRTPLYYMDEDYPAGPEIQ